MVRKTNFTQIGIRGETKKEIDELKKRLEECYPSATYDELMKILMEKNSKIIFSNRDIKKIILKERGIII